MGTKIAALRRLKKDTTGGYIDRQIHQMNSEKIIRKSIRVAAFAASSDSLSSSACVVGLRKAFRIQMHGAAMIVMMNAATGARR